MFQNLLIQKLRESTAWQELADGLEKLNAQVVEPHLTRLKNMPSVFTMHKDDIQVLFDELGQHFAVGQVKDEDIPLLLQQRQDEIHFKGHEYSLQKTFEREFLGIPMSYEPLYAPKDLNAHPYGSKLLLLRDIENEGLNRDDYFLTQRAVIFARLDQVKGKMGVHEFERLLASVAIPLIPTHICFDGQQYYLEALILGDYAIEPVVTGSSVTDTATKETQDHPIQIQIKDQSERVSDKLSIAESAQASYERSNLIAMDDYSLDSILLDINYNRGNH
uniref:Phage protein n=2 Tax=Vibrio TaxID=662 RepID=A0A0H3ZLN6_9VIBR|nr:Phage protein [Vibrio cyclitrophicus]AKN38223.1 hypothetical protein [Vibrio splendidus]